MEKWVKRRTAAWKSEDWKAFLVLAGGLFLLIISAVLGEVHRKNRLGEVDREAGEMIFTSAEGISLRREDLDYLQELETFIAGVSVHQAARQLARDEERLYAIRESVSQVLGNETLYICGGRPVSSLTGMGLAVREDHTCFYGNFREGRPEGVCTAIACFHGKTSGYEYSMGIWKNGRMEGLGITGKYSWKNEEKERGTQEQTSGVFQEDYLDGQLTYEQIDPQGRSCWWEIRAEEGRTCLDQRWIFRPALGEYRLLSEKEKRAFFVLPQNLLEQVWWENRVPWE